jgi:antitoxin VapB
MLNNLFGTMRSEAMRLPAAFRFEGKQVEIERDPQTGAVDRMTGVQPA